MKHKMKHSFVMAIAIFTVVGISKPAPVQAGCANCSTWFNQTVDHIQQALIYINKLKDLTNQYQQYQTQINQYLDMVQNTENLVPGLWDLAEQDLLGLSEVVKEGRAIAYSLGNIDELFREKYKGYENYRDDAILANNETYSEAYSEWNTTNYDTLNGILKGLGLQSDMLVREDQVIDRLRDMSRTSQGRMQALQAGNEIATEGLRQMQKLRQLTMMQIQGQSTYMAAENDKSAAQEANRQEYYSDGAAPNRNDNTRF